jgi:hypothetical protein
MPQIIATHDGPEISAKLARLIDFGFIFVGSWEISPTGIDFTLLRFAEDSVLYAFAVEGDLRYIGKAQQLSARMQAYKFPGKAVTEAENTNKANNRRIREQLDRGRRVKILAFRPAGPWEYRGVPIDLVAGMEEALIFELDPDWNDKARELRKRFGVTGGRMGEQLLKLWLYLPLVEQLQKLASRNGNPIDAEASEAITKHVQENGFWPPPKKGQKPQEFREPT